VAEEEEKPGHFRVEMDGEWDLDDLGSMTTSVRLSYAYFYWVFKDPQLVDQVVRSGISRYFWSGDFIGDKFARTLYERIPAKDRLRLVSIHFASPGWMELAAVALPAVAALGYVTRIWITNAGKAVDVMQKIDEFFATRKLREIKKGSITDIDGDWIDEARDLCFEYGRFLGMEDARIEAAIELAGNPIAGLKLLVAISNEARRLYQLAGQGKIRLPGTPISPSGNEDDFFDEDDDRR
jgi:hypothetical protein